MGDDYQRDVIMASLKNLKGAMGEKLSFEKFIAASVESIMMLEREEYLRELTERKEKDKGNGFYRRLFESFKTHNLHIHVPRTRSGTFQPDSMQLVKISEEERNQFCLELYKKGMTSRDIESLMKNFFGNAISPTSITNMAKGFRKIREAWENSKLERHYLFIHFDVIFITVRRGNSYSKEGVYIAYGVREDCKRELLILDNNPTESASMWETYMKTMKERGVEEVDLFIGDGLTGMENTIMKQYPNAKFQKCVVHKMRSVLNSIRPKEKEEVAEDLKQVFDNFESGAELEKCKEKVKTFTDKWRKKYPQITRYFSEDTIEYYFTYIQFPAEIRRMIYTTNSIENLNKSIRKATKNKLSFESPETLLDYVFIVIKDFEESNWMKYSVSSFRNYQLLQTQTQFT
ncbi:IS256 family transposase [Candidatus Roizmanbacteria bacterium]|nr:IS256 family transposase [Candidatus Roizmanbacteria bacterium]